MTGMPCRIQVRVRRTARITGSPGPLARPAVGVPGHRMPMPGLPAQPVIHFAIGRRQVTMTDCNEQFVIS
jgi:hypothetical protein